MMFGAIAEQPERREQPTVSFAAGAARRARGALLRPGAVRRRATRPDPPRAPRRGGVGARLMAPAAIVLGGVIAVLAVAGVFTPRQHTTRRSAASLAPALAPQAVGAAKPHKPRRRHSPHQARRRVSRPATTSHTVAAVPRASTTPVQTSPTTQTTTQPQPTVTAHVIGGPKQQAPPKTAASGPGPSGYQPATTP
jgi:hypothetical protein